MSAALQLASIARPAAPLDCGVPVDTQYFDDARFDATPRLGGHVVLARFELPLQYCGVLECFSQFTDLWSRAPAEVETPGLIWQIQVNRQPLYPYHDLRAIVNPWGYGSFPMRIRLAEGAAVELIARRIAEHISVSGQTVARIGGRLMGRFWYNNHAYGDAR